MEGDGDRKKELPDLNECREGEKKRFLEGDGGRWSRINDRIASAADREYAVYWESVLNLTSMHVLLVEKDEATRLIIAVLLRKCGYQVTVAANGLQAWKILKDLRNHIDLVLSEVDIPCLSGINLLCNIMSHNTCKHIPVVMMSFDDSMGLVFNCLSKGAVDFLMKPLRKNELKNLWQHVWRRCHCSCGSWSEVGTEAQKSVKSEGVEDFDDDNTCSNDEDDNWSFALRDGSARGSDNQISWIKHDVEVNSPQSASPLDQKADCPDGRCAQVIHCDSEAFSKLTPTTSAREFQEHMEQLGNAAVGKNLKTGLSRNLDLQLEYPVEVPVNVVDIKQNIVSEIESNKFDEAWGKGKSETASSNLKQKTAKLTYVDANTTVAYLDNREFEASSALGKISEVNNKAVNDTKEALSFDLLFKRLRKVENIRNIVQDDGNILGHIGLSAFSRNTRSDFTCDKSSEVVKDSLLNFQSNAKSSNPCSDGIINSFSNAAMGKDLKIGISRNLDLKHKHTVEVSAALVGTKENIFSEIESNKFGEIRNKGQGDSSAKNLKEKTSAQMCPIPYTTLTYMDNREIEAPTGPFEISKIKNEAVCDAKEPPSLDLTFKRLREVEGIGNTVQDDNGLFRQLGLSVFSRNTGSGSPGDNGSK